MKDASNNCYSNVQPFSPANTLNNAYKGKSEFSPDLNTKIRPHNSIKPNLCGSMTKSCATPEPTKEFSPDQLDIEILKLVKEHYHGRGIARILNRAPSTVKLRLDKMEKAGALQSGKGEFNTKIYSISTNANRFLIHNEAGASVPVFSAHCMEFKFPILEGQQPKSKQAYNMRNWRGYVWREGDYVIRSTPKNIIVSVNIDLGAGTIDDLVLKYSEVSRTKAFDFAGRYNLILGLQSLNRPPHYTMEDQALSQLATMRGEFKTKSGIMLDKSKSSGDIEMTEDKARSLEFVINSMPELVGELVGNYETLKDRVDSIQETLSQVLLLAQINDLRAKAQDMQKSTNSNLDMTELKNLQAQIDDFYTVITSLESRLSYLEQQKAPDKS